MRAALSIVGIGYMVYCFYLVGSRGLGGWATVVSMWVVGIIILMVIKPEATGYNGPKDGWSALESRVFSDDGQSINLKDLMGGRAGAYGYYKDGIRYNFEPEVYALHDPQSDSYICSPWLFHPGCLFWSPFLIALFTAVSWVVTGNR
ncbi:MAG: hypothetical protein ACYSSP_12020 [Planctomycetota bacterium]